MKKAQHILIVAFAMTFLPLTNSFAALITADVLDSYVEIGETFNVDIWADSEVAGWELTAFGFDVVDSSDSVFSYTGYTITPNFSDASDPSNNSNITGFGDPSAPAVGKVLLSTLSFIAGNAGVETFSLSGDYDGMFYGLFYFDPTNSSDPFPGANISLSQIVTVHPIENGTNPVPEPSTILLLGSGLIGLAGYRRKQKKV